MKNLKDAYAYLEVTGNDMVGKAGGSGEACWTPNVDVYSTETGVVVTAELAGINREDVEISVEGLRLKITGERPDGFRSLKCQFHVMEVNYGPFEVVIDLPEGHDLSRSRAGYHNGFLRIEVPRKNRRRPK